MADEFSFLTDSDDERAVEDVLSQAMDHSVLEQVAAINCSSFSTSDNLPLHLETRFRKLKSLPTTTSAARSRFPPSRPESLRPRSAGDDSNVEERHHGFGSSGDFEHIEDGKKGLESFSSANSPEDHSDGNRDDNKGQKSNTKSKSSSNTNLDSGLRKKKGLKSKSGTGSSESHSDSWSLSSPDSESGTVSPPRRRIGCLWCSPKKEKSVERKKGKENRESWGKDAEILSDLKTLSMKKQEKMMKKAKKEEEKINREAEKIVKWAKQASARMLDVSGLHHELSDFDNTK